MCTRVYAYWYSNGNSEERHYLCPKLYVCTHYHFGESVWVCTDQILVYIHSFPLITMTGSMYFVQYIAAGVECIMTPTALRHAINSLLFVHGVVFIAIQRP
ncbi:e1.4 [Ichnoviriform fugitivi]|uniref:E1.4 n=1 Tax=Ichnoviriform fugitivi TaxID=265522 RepID=A2Q0N9_9VIRU|nr:e1.4 [Ichnoviriform fugitivi]BAF45754.1 e1.4 [Ichnoviriform fugitivi]